jgi:nucleotide-binding universal stress UspA family protein
VEPRALRLLLAPGRHVGVRGECTVALGDPATAILDLAEAQDADLIVVGTREAGLLERLIDPSVSGAVHRKAHCDVLVVY